MKRSASHLHVAKVLQLLGGLMLSASSAMAALVSMPTPLGDRNFDTATFASGILQGPSGESACFSAGTSSPCASPSQLQLAVLGPDLTTGLSLGLNGLIRLSLPAPGPRLVVWEAGNFDAAGDVGESRVSVHTAAGWSSEHTYGPGHVARVAGDTLPSGYPTNFGEFTAQDFGLPPGTAFDAVQFRSCCGDTAHADILAVAAIPEPGTLVLMLAGVMAMMALSHRRRAGQGAPCFHA
jgi:hypothetical protein